MSDQEIHIIAIIYPEPGKKAERLKELLKPMCKDVHSKEDYTLRYIMTEQLDSENPDIVMIETYKDKDAATKHTKEPHFKELFGTFEKEGLMRQPPYLAQTKSKAGFERDRKLFS
ncbi:Dimeric alpha+beta barrel like protein [Teratosphaeria destructans]|uniref:Dimeric alpha+beta barrel like protein n=1 Tax=Teratosphaeria destructans TaxID=418781 RepID=A0A9W7W7A0_9PEZI|nr:Dimeric alpha+beta barrel like protein [Teratosphaeria destructans]